ncbi:MAG: hypothetical protein IKO93_17745 [Lentisphaeria bacterium]|nr:hypothetical protein [Lentisphaeria bacterium]
MFARSKIAVICLAVLSVCRISGAENPIRDGGFEGKKGKDGISAAWENYVFDGAETVTRLEERTKDPASGRKSVVVRRISGGSLGGIIQRRIKVRENTPYTLTVRVRNGQDSAAFVRIEFLNDAGVLLGQFVSEDFNPAEWKTLSADFRTPDAAVAINVILGMRGRSWTAFDDVSLAVNDKAPQLNWDGFAARCIPVETVAAWLGKPVFSTFEDSPCALSFQFRGNSRKVVKPALILDLPVELRMAEAFQQHPGWGSALVPKVSDLEIDGRKYRRYRFDRSAIFQRLLASWGWQRILNVAVMPAEKNASGKEYTAYWQLENKNELSPRKQFTIRILPALPERPMPKDFYVGMWVGYENDHPSREVFMAAIRKMEKSNMIGTVLLSPVKGNNDILRQRGWRLASGSFQGDQAYQFSHLPKELQKKLKPKFYARYADGKTYNNRVCPQFFLTDPDYTRFAEKSMKDALKNLKDGERVILDSEPWRPHYWCYCDDCIAAFTEFAGLKDRPAAAGITRKYYSQWRAFRVEQSRRVIAKLTALAKQTKPQSPVYDYNYPIDYDSQKAIDVFLSRCSKDPRGMESFLSGHLCSFYHTLGKSMFDLVRTGRKHLKKDYFPILAIDPPGYLAKASVLSPDRFRMMTEAAAALGCKGVWIYSTTVVDGSMIKGIHEAMVKIARVEDFYRTPELPGKIRVKSGSDQVRSTTHELNGKTLVSVFNFDDKKGAEVTIPVKGQPTDVLSGKELKATNGELQLKLPPNGDCFIRF